MTDHDDILKMTTLELARAIRTKEVSAKDALDASLDRMDLLEPRIHAFCTPTVEVARAAAGDVDRAIARGDEVGSLAGVPMGVKDLICTAGVPTVCGSFAYKDFVPDEDDVVVERIKAAGAVMLGKTNVPEFGYSGVGHNPVFETTRNPWNTDMTSGGSSAGSAAAVAAGMCSVALGTDGGGSIRIPSALCGVYGMKASMGRVPLYPGCRDERYPGVSSWESLEHIGPIARTVEDAALLLSVIAGPDDRDRFSLPPANFDWLDAVHKDVAGCRVAFSPDLGNLAVDPEVRRVTTEAASVFERELGCHVESASPRFDYDPTDVNWTLAWTEADLKGMRAMADKYADKMTAHVVANIRRNWTIDDINRAVLARKSITNVMWRFMRNYDFFITPTVAVPAFPVHMQGPEKIDGRIVSPNAWLGFLGIYNLTGQPAATVPAGFTRDGLPVGLQIIGAHLADEIVLGASAAFERARPWAGRWPEMVTNLKSDRD